jgi:hypothetical protein
LTKIQAIFINGTVSRRIKTIPDLIAHFGGLTSVAPILGTSPQNVVHWRTGGYIPAHHYKRHKRLLHQADPRLEVSDDLWGWVEAADAAE